MGGGGVSAVKVAVTTWLLSIVRVMGLVVPITAPDQPVKVWLGSAVAVNVTTWPAV